MAKLIPSIACLGSAKFCPLNNSFDQYSIASFILTASIEQGRHKPRVMCVHFPLLRGTLGTQLPGAGG
jgi:hypothetical protein